MSTERVVEANASPSHLHDVTREHAHVDALFTRTQRATFTALAKCILQEAPASGESFDGFVTSCEARLSALPAHRRARMSDAVDALGGRTAVLVGVGRVARFVDLDALAQAQCFAAWGSSRFAPLRAAHQAVRKLVMTVHYAHPLVSSAIGYDGPLQSRTPNVAWEGPLPGPTRDDEPIARGPIALPNAISRDPQPENVITAASIAHDLHRTADVVVIGSGAGGAVTAARLSEAGYQVVILESGSYFTRADFTEDESTLNARLYADGALRTTDDMSFALLQGHAVGGSSTINWMVMLRTPDAVLNEWANEHGVYGMQPREMRPVFERIEREVRARVVPNDAHSANNRLLLDGAASLGWRAYSARINADGCVRCGFCGIGCRHNAKQSALLTYLPRALTAGATLYADACVTNIALRERDTGTGTPPLKRVTAQIGMRSAGAPRQLTIDAPLVVVACGGIETPALLQRSGFGGGGVGEWLRLHPTTAITGVYARDILSSVGIPLSSVCDEFSRWQESDYGFWLECPPMHPSFAAAAVSGFGRTHADRMHEFRRSGVLIALTRDGADRRVSNGSVRVDRSGNTSIRYRLGREDQRRVRASLEAAARIHLVNGAREVVSMHAQPVVVRAERELSRLSEASLAPNRVAMFSAHVNGTCRMGIDPERSGATPEGERHGVRGLYISDGALLPTSLGVNPQETIMAVATVLAERMATRHAGVTRV